MFHRRNASVTRLRARAPGLVPSSTSARKRPRCVGGWHRGLARMEYDAGHAPDPGLALVGSPARPDGVCKKGMDSMVGKQRQRKLATPPRPPPRLVLGRGGLGAPGCPLSAPPLRRFL